MHSRRMRRWWLSGVVVVGWACGGPAERSGLDASAMGEAGLQLDLDASADGSTAVPEGGDRCQTREQQLTVSSRAHVTGDVVYADPPPVGGDHNACWAKWDVYEDELADERWVHNLEHGGVVFLYRCPDGCRAEIDTMKVFVSGRTQALMTPYAALPTRFAVVAWGVRLTTNCFDMPAFQRFYNEHVDNAPESLAADPQRSCL